MSLPFAALVAVLLLAGSCTESTPAPSPRNTTPTTPPAPTEKPAVAETEYDQMARCTRVVDGDTIVLDTGDKVRLIGIDTPESVHPRKPVEYFALKASAFTKRLVEGEDVGLRFDQANAHLGHRGRYGRLLAYVYRARDRLDVNAEIVRQGYGHAYTKYPFSRSEEFLALQREAREEGRGLWGSRSEPVTSSLRTEETGTTRIRAPPATDTETVYVTRTGEKYHRATCRYLRRSKIPIRLGEARAEYQPCRVCKPPR